MKEMFERRLAKCVSVSHLAGAIRTDLSSFYSGWWQVFIGRTTESFFVYTEKCPVYVVLRVNGLDCRIQCVQ